MENKIHNKFNLVYTIVILFIFITIAGACFFNAGRAGYNSKALLFYGLGSVIGIVLTIYFGLFGVFNLKTKINQPQLSFLQLGHISEINPLAPISNYLPLKLIIAIVWVIIVGVFAFGGFQVFPTPNVYSGISSFATNSGSYASQTVGIARSIWEVAITPGFTEDMVAFALSLVFMAIILLWILIMFGITKKPIFKINAVWYAIAIIVACPIAAIGIGFVPGFAQAHENVAGANISYYASTFIFQTFNLYVMHFTGLWLPLAHIVHNAIFALGFSIAYTIAFASILPIFYVRYKKNKLKNKI